VRRAAWGVLAVALLAFVVRGATSPDDPYLVGVDGQRQLIAGFEEISFTITSPDGDVLDWCAMLAATEALRAQGLMHQTDLGGYDGMVFRFDEPTGGGFWMKNTIIPLAVAYFDADGHFVSAQGMDPCPEDAETCPSHPPAGPYLHAIEVPRGGLGRIGVGPGSQLAFSGEPCP
jgi:uncharacterized membrane protein (UPF0127 family)